MLKKTLESLEGVDESLHSYYEESESGGFRLKIDGDEEDRFKQKHQEAEKHRKNAEKQAQELQARLDQIEEEQRLAREEADKKKAKDSNDWESYEKSLREQHTKALTKLQDESEQKINTLMNQVKSMTAGTAASDMANKLAIDSHAAENIRDYVSSRLSVDTSGDKPRVVVMDTEGNPTALTLDEFEAEVREMPRFQHVISGSKASGGGASGGNHKGGGAPNNKPVKDWSAKEKSAYIASNGLEAFQQLVRGN